MSVLDQFRLDGKVALVTGGAGIVGRQVVEALAEAGAKTFMASRNLAKLQSQADDFRRAGLDVAALPLDQADAESIVQLSARVLEIAGPVDILVNNAVLRPMKDWDAPV